MYMSIRTLDYVIFSHQVNLSKTTKHWDGFVSHCIGLACGVVAPVQRNDLIGAMSTTIAMFDRIYSLDHTLHWVENNCFLCSIEATCDMFNRYKAQLADFFEDVE